MRSANHIMRFFVALIFVGVLFAGHPAAWSQEATSLPATQAVAPSAEVDLSIDGLQKRIKAFDDNVSMDAAIKEKTIAVYKLAIAEIQKVTGLGKKSAGFSKMRTSAADKLAGLKKQLKDLDAKAAYKPPVGASAKELASLLTESTAELASYKKSFSDIEIEINHRAERQKKAPAQLAEAKKQLEELKQKNPAVAEEPAELTEARNMLWRAKRLALQTEIEVVDKELSAYDAEHEAIVVQRDLLARKTTLSQKKVETIQGLLDTQRAEEARLVAEKAAQQLKDVHPALRTLAEENVNLATLRTGEGGITSQLDKITASLAEVESLLARVRLNAQRLKEREKIAGLTHAVSALLRKYQKELPDLRVLNRKIRQDHPEMMYVGLKLEEFRDQRADIVNPDNQAKEIVAGIKPGVSGEEAAKLSKEALRLLKAKREYLDALIKDYDDYFEKLITLNASMNSLEVETRELGNRIEEKILWIRSSKPLGLSDFKQAGKEFQMFLQPDNWASVGRELRSDAYSQPVVGFFVVVFVVLLVFRPLFTRKLRQCGQAIIRGEKEAFRRTLKALLYTFMIGVPLPGLIFLLSWSLSTAPDSTEFVRAFGHGLFPVGAILLTIGLTIQVCRTGGLAEAHFKWSPESMRILRRWLRILAPLEVPLVFITATVGWMPETIAESSLGRIALILALLTLTVFNAMLFRPGGRLGQNWYKLQKGWLYRLRYEWYTLVVAVSVLLILLTWVGYFLLAAHLTWKVLASFWLIIGIVVFRGLVIRWLTTGLFSLAVHRRRIQKGSADEIEHEYTDPAKIRIQSHRVLQYSVVTVLLLGLWGIWADSLPMLRGIGRVSLWHTTSTVTVESTNAKGEIVTIEENRPSPVTISDLVTACVITVLTFIAAGSLPGLLSFAMLKRLDMDEGAKYATTVIFRYVIGVVGLVVAANMAGLRWGSIQWLVAAMTVGLGFGLQEIFANFVSGLIILFERPIRLGDTVTIGETVGTVSKLRIRATTITDWDRKELIVPNKEFVSNRLVNWTLSDQILRMILRVGIAYGSDTQLAEKVLLELAQQQPLVLNDPKPRVVFTGFGDNSLDFELRLYISGIEHYLDVWHGMNMAIDKAFREAEITIAFPQRDTHLDTLSPLEIQILPPKNSDA